MSGTYPKEVLFLHELEAHFHLQREIQKGQMEQATGIM